MVGVLSKDLINKKTDGGSLTALFRLALPVEIIHTKDPQLKVK